jgi:hypothetical protein
MKRKQFHLLFSILLLLIVSQSIAGIKCPLPITTGFYASSGSQLLADVILDIDNYASTDMDITLYNITLDTYYYINISPYHTDVPLTVPEGTYDINIWADDGGSSYHHYMVGCGTYGGGYGSVNFYGVALNSTCNNILLDY